MLQHQTYPQIHLFVDRETGDAVILLGARRGDLERFIEDHPSIRLWSIDELIERVPRWSKGVRYVRGIYSGNLHCNAKRKYQQIKGTAWKNQFRQQQEYRQLSQTTS